MRKFRIMRARSRAAALIIAPMLLVGSSIGVLAGTASAGQPPVATTSTMTNTYVTDATWMTSGGEESGPAVIECANPAWTASIPNANWIWAPDVIACVSGSPGNAPVETVGFTKVFNITGTPEGGTLLLAADNSATVTINGTTIQGTTGDSSGATPYNFQNVATVDITSYLVTGTNTITINGTNAPYTCGTATCNPAGILASLTVTSSLSSTAWCKNGGWQSWTDANGNPFKHQGDCVSYVVSHGIDPSNG